MGERHLARHATSIGALVMCVLSVTFVFTPPLAFASTTTSTPTSTTTTSLSTTTSSTATAAANLACAMTSVSSWTLSQLANETIVVSVNVANVGAMTPAAKDGFGGLLLFGTSAPANIAATIARVQARTLHPYPMLVMTDEEGGGVQRLTNVTGSIPWASTMGRNLSSLRITDVGSRIGRALLSAGVNVDLAPVLDVDGRHVQPGRTNPDGYRSFSGSATIVARDAAAFMKGLGEANVTSVLKHFPGLGGASQNTDYGPATTRPWSQLQKTGLVPFEVAIDAGAPAVMLSNASVPGLTSLPAGLSPAVVQELRQNLGFKGLIMTDSLSAGAIGALHLAPPAAAVKALQAGVNLILAGGPQSPVSSLTLARGIASAVESAVNSGALSLSTLISDAAQVLVTRNVIPC